MDRQPGRQGPLVAIRNAAIVFVPETARPSSDPALRREFLQVGERLARLAAPAAADIALEAAASATCIPVDGAGRCLPGPWSDDGQLGPDLWVRFAHDLPVLDEAPPGPRSPLAPFCASCHSSSTNAPARSGPAWRRSASRRTSSGNTPSRRRPQGTSIARCAGRRGGTSFRVVSAASRRRRRRPVCAASSGRTGTGRRVPPWRRRRPPSRHAGSR